jgi:uncharacterized protein (TIGR00266 family)
MGRFCGAPAGRTTVIEEERLQSKVSSGHTPAVVIGLDPGEEVVAESGAMMFLSGGVTMKAGMHGGLAGGLKRAMAGESLFLTTYRAETAGGAVGLTGPYPGSIRELSLDGSTDVICERHAYLGHHGGVHLEKAYSKKLWMCWFGGGEGFVLQRISGTGTVWLHGGGDFIDFTLADGQGLVVDTGCMVCFDATVRYEVKMQPGIGAGLMGGEGFFLVHMTGPGRVTLQTLPFSRTAAEVLKAVGGGADERKGFLGNILQ